MKSMLTEIKKSLEESKGQFSKEPAVDFSKLNNDQLNGINSQLGLLKSDLQKLREESSHKFKLAFESLCGKDELQLLEAKIIEKLNELIKTFYNAFADKNDCKNKFSSLAKDMKSLFELLMQK